MTSHVPAALVVCLALLVAPARALDEPGGVGPNEVAGTVTDDGGKPIAGVLVDAWTWQPGHEVTTGADGRFHLKGIHGMPNSDLGPIVELRFTKPGLSPVYIRSQPLGVGDLGVRMNDLTYVEGTLRSPDGRPLPNVPIRADSGPKTVNAEGFTISVVWTDTTSDDAGRFRLYLAPDKYRIHVRVPTRGVALVPVVVPENEAVAQDITLEEGVRFVVRCVDGDAQAPAAGVTISARGVEGISATSGADGLVTFEHLPAGRFQFGGTSDEYAKWWWPDSTVERQRRRETHHRWSSDGITVELAPGTRPLALMLEKGVPVSGRVVDPQGKPVAGALVVTARTGYGDAIDQTRRFTARTKADGTFAMRLPSSAPVQFNLIAHEGDYGTWRQWANGVSEPMDLEPGDVVKDLTLTLTAGATIKGRVVDAQGNPRPGTEVRAMSADGQDSRYVAPSARTDAEGKFTLTHVRPGEVRVEVEPFWVNEPDDPDPARIEHAVVTADAGRVTEDVTVTLTRQDRDSPAGGPGL